MAELPVYDDPILTWDDIADDLAMAGDEQEDDRLRLDLETVRFVPALDGRGLQRVIGVYGPESAWIRRWEEQWRLDVADATCHPAVIR